MSQANKDTTKSTRDIWIPKLEEAFMKIGMPIKADYSKAGQCFITIYKKPSNSTQSNNNEKQLNENKYNY